MMIVTTMMIIITMMMMMMMMLMMLMLMLMTMTTDRPVRRIVRNRATEVAKELGPGRYGEQASPGLHEEAAGPGRLQPSYHSISGLLGLQGGAGLPDLGGLKRKREDPAEEEKPPQGEEEESKRARAQWSQQYPGVWGRWAAGQGIKEEKAAEGGHYWQGITQEGLYDAMSQAYPALPSGIGGRRIADTPKYGLFLGHGRVDYVLLPPNPRPPGGSSCQSSPVDCYPAVPSHPYSYSYPAYYQAAPNPGIASK
jgi:hypothetical protein